MIFRGVPWPLTSFLFLCFSYRTCTQCWYKWNHWTFHNTLLIILISMQPKFANTTANLHFDTIRCAYLTIFCKRKQRKAWKKILWRRQTISRIVTRLNSLSFDVFDVKLLLLFWLTSQTDSTWTGRRQMDMDMKTNRESSIISLEWSFHHSKNQRSPPDLLNVLFSFSRRALVSLTPTPRCTASC